MPDLGVTAAGACALVLACLAAGCGSGGDDGGDAPDRPPAPQGLAPPERLAGTYSLDGRERRVRLAVTPTLITRKRRNDYAVVPRGRRMVQVDLRLDDSGRDRFDLRLASFEALDSGGARVRETFRLPVRSVEPGNPRGPRVVSVGFMLRRGRTVAGLRMGSIAAGLPARLRWRLSE